jgi:hypothetical protein
MKKQILHILMNDIRHFWRELVLMVAIVVAYGWYTSIHLQDSGFVVMDTGLVSPSQILSLLAPLSFIFVILRVIHAECPVGDHQFWVTRPYDWRKLLAAKLLFVATFVNVPLFTLQFFLLWHGGFWPPRYMSGLLQFQLIWTAFIFLPVTALAVVTASIGQFALGAFGLLLYLVAFGELVSKIPNSGVSGTEIIPTGISLILFYTVILSVILRQYARRTTAWSRTVLLALGAAVPVLFALIPYRMVIAHMYPVPGSDKSLPVHLAFDPAKPTSLKGGYSGKNEVHIKLPLLVSGIAEGTKVIESGILVRINARGGSHWESGWRAGRGELLANRPNNSETFAMERNFFERVKSVPVDVQLTFALTPAHANQVSHVVAGPGLFTVPGDGRCSFSPLSPHEAVCLFPPVKEQGIILLSARTEEITCRPGESAKSLPVGIIAYGSVLQMGGSFLNPISASVLGLADFGDIDARNFLGSVCPGSPLTMYLAWQYGPGYRADLEFDDIRLADYKLDDSTNYGDGFGIFLPLP